MAAVGTLEEQALQRKAKLKALRSKKSEQQSVSESLRLYLRVVLQILHLLPTFHTGGSATGRDVCV